MRSRWSQASAEKLSGLDLLVYATRLIGSDPTLVLWGGGNSSLKGIDMDHTGRETPVLWIKGSGSDMRTITPSQFTTLRLDDLRLLLKRESMSDEEMVAYQLRCMVHPGQPNPSIETLLHAFIPAPHVYHTHADVICTLLDVSDTASLIKDIYGDGVAVVPYRRPGFALAKLVADAVSSQPHSDILFLDKHGLVTWGDTAEEAYGKTIEAVQKAERFIKPRVQTRNGRYADGDRQLPADRRHEWAERLAVTFRRTISRQERKILLYDDSPDVLQFVNCSEAKDLSQSGPFTPDHILHTKSRPLFLELPPPERADALDALDAIVEKAVESYRENYVQSFERHATPGLRMLDPYPRVMLVQGVGMFTSGKDRRACRVAHDLYLHTMAVSRACAAIDRYTTLSAKDQFEFEYWPLELYKLSLLPSEKEMSRRVVLLTGAAGAIGRSIAARMVAAGAAVVLTDIDADGIRRLSHELNQSSGEENTVAVPMNVTRERSVVDGIARAVLAYGGLDVVVSNAGIARTGPVENLSLQAWEESMAVNARGHFLVCREAMRIFHRQQLGGNIVVVATKNVPAPGKDFGAYSASKAAQAQLARVLAIEGADCGVRVNMVNPDGILEGSGLWSDDVRRSRAASYGIPVEKLEEFYAMRNLLRVKVTALDVAEAVLFLASGRSAKTTGAMLSVDGGVKEAFAR